MLYDRRTGKRRDTRLSSDNSLCWICRERHADSAEHKATASDIRSMCSHCNNAGTQVYDEAWRRLSSYLQANWREITARGSFDLSKVFGAETAKQAVRVQLYFVKILGCKLLDDGIRVDLETFSKALMAGDGASGSNVARDQQSGALGSNVVLRVGCQCAAQWRRGIQRSVDELGSSGGNQNLLVESACTGAGAAGVSLAPDATEEDCEAESLQGGYRAVGGAAGFEDLAGSRYKNFSRETRSSSMD